MSVVAFRGDTALAGAPLAVDIRDLRFQYPDGTEALAGVSLQVQEGQRVALVGPNGAGKSTLLLHLNGLLRGEGYVRVLGLAPEPQNLRLLRRQVGLVFQNPDDQIFMPTVFDEVAYAAVNEGWPEEEIKQRVQEAMQATGVAHLATKHPLSLSVGQKKRVAIASVLVTDNKLLALDEPSAGLDPAGKTKLLSLLQTLASTMIVATHDLDFARQLCDWGAAMKNGRIWRTGPLEELSKEPSLFEP